MLTSFVYGSIGHTHRSHIYNAACESRKCRYFSSPLCDLCIFAEPAMGASSGGHPGRRPRIIRRGGSCRPRVRSQAGSQSVAAFLLAMFLVAAFVIAPSGGRFAEIGWKHARRRRPTRNAMPHPPPLSIKLTLRLCGCILLRLISRK